MGIANNQIRGTWLATVHGVSKSQSDRIEWQSTAQHRIVLIGSELTWSNLYNIDYKGNVAGKLSLWFELLFFEIILGQKKKTLQKYLWNLLDVVPNVLVL